MAKKTISGAAQFGVSNLVYSALDNHEKLVEGKYLEYGKEVGKDTVIGVSAGFVVTFFTQITHPAFALVFQVGGMSVEAKKQCDVNGITSHECGRETSRVVSNGFVAAGIGAAVTATGLAMLPAAALAGGLYYIGGSGVNRAIDYFWTPDSTQ